jgi:hypothetical protein
MSGFNILEQARLIRRLAVNSEKIKRIESFLKGQPLGTVRFADAVITVAKILDLNANKIISGTLTVGQEIIVNDGDEDRILITRDDVRISKPGQDVKQVITEATKKNFILLSIAETHKIYKADFFTSSYSHGLGKVPFFLSFEVDDVNNPTYFKPISLPVTNTQILSGATKVYVIIFSDGGNP